MVSSFFDKLLRYSSIFSFCALVFLYSYSLAAATFSSESERISSTRY